MLVFVLGVRVWVWVRVYLDHPVQVRVLDAERLRLERMHAMESRHVLITPLLGYGGPVEVLWELARVGPEGLGVETRFGMEGGVFIRRATGAPPAKMSGADPGDCP